jgi:hypothetical protein
VAAGVGAGAGGRGGVVPNQNVTLTPAQVAAVAAQAGFSGRALQTAVAISFAEDGSHDASAQHRNSNGTLDTGLWQINSVHPQWTSAQLVQPSQNAAAAYTLSAGGHDWSPWTTYNDGAYVAQMAAAARAVSDMQSQGGPNRVASGIPAAHGDSLPGADAVSGVIDTVESVPHFLGLLSDVGTWERVGYVAAGLALGAFGVYAVVRSLGINPPVPIPV